MQIYKNYFNSYTKSLIILEIKNAKNKNGVQHSINRIKTTVYTRPLWAILKKNRTEVLLLSNLRMIRKTFYLHYKYNLCKLQIDKYKD